MPSVPCVRPSQGSVQKPAKGMHPSWRNSGWLKKNSWFEAEILPVLRREVARLTA